MIIDDPIQVLKLWADWYRPRLKMRQIPSDKSNWPPPPSPKDDRRVQARVTVECTPGYRKAFPILMKVHVNNISVESLSEQHRAVYGSFVDALRVRLAGLPIIVHDPNRVLDDFEVTVNQAVSMLAGCGTPVTERTILRWIKDKLIISREQGQKRMVKWSEVVARAPRRRDPKNAFSLAA